MKDADEMLARAISRLNKAQKPKRARGRPVSEEAEARRAEAAVLGVSERTVRRAQHREEADAAYFRGVQRAVAIIDRHIGEHSSLADRDVRDALVAVLHEVGAAANTGDG